MFSVLTQNVCSQNKINILDFTSIQSLFDKLNKQLDKAQKVTESAEPPRLYIKLLVHLTVSHRPLFPDMNKLISRSTVIGILSVKYAYLHSSLPARSQSSYDLVSFEAILRELYLYKYLKSGLAQLQVDDRCLAVTDQPYLCLCIPKIAHGLD